MLIGQFDSGSSGGAIAFVNVMQGHILNTQFVANAAFGFYGFSSYSSSGSGGAILLKFSSLIISSCEFINNWVTVGGSQLSVGGAIAGMQLLFVTLSINFY